MPQSYSLTRPATDRPSAERPGTGRPDRRRDSCLDAALRWSPAQIAFRALAGHRLAVLTYRRVEDPAAFAAQLDRLVRIAHPVSLADVDRAVAGERALPPRSALVTFDDGDRTVLTRALPLLRERGVPAAVFVTTGAVGTERPFWWSEAEFLARHGGTARSLPSGGPEGLVRRLLGLPDPDRRRSIQELRVSAARQAPPQLQLTPEDLRTLRREGVGIGNHTVGHPRLDRCDEATVRSEIVDAHLALTRWLGTEPTAFSYPHGAADDRAEAVLRDLGYRLAFVSDHRLGPGRPPAPLRISRLRMDSGIGRHRFDTVVSGLRPAVRRWRR